MQYRILRVKEKDYIHTTFIITRIILILFIMIGLEIKSYPKIPVYGRKSTVYVRLLSSHVSGIHWECWKIVPVDNGGLLHTIRKRAIVCNAEITTDISMC